MSLTTIIDFVKNRWEKPADNYAEKRQTVSENPGTTFNCISYKSEEKGVNCEIEDIVQRIYLSIT